VADGAVLTENTAQITSAKKDGSRAARAAVGRFFPQMRSYASDQKILGRGAKAVVIPYAFYLTFTRTLAADHSAFPLPFFIILSHRCAKINKVLQLISTALK
jgi:hypothetical protein